MLIIIIHKGVKIDSICQFYLDSVFQVPKSFFKDQVDFESSTFRKTKWF